VGQPPHNSDRDSLAVTRTGSGSYVRLVLSGDLEVSTTPMLRKAILEACAQPSTAQLVVDLEALHFLDSIGMSTLVWAKETALAGNIDFAVVNCRGMPRRALEVTGLYVVLVRDPPAA